MLDILELAICITLHLYHFIHNVQFFLPFLFSFNKFKLYDYYKLCYIVIIFALNSLLSYKGIKNKKVSFLTTSYCPLYTISSTPRFLEYFHLLSFFFNQNTSFKISCSAVLLTMIYLSISISLSNFISLLKDIFDIDF